MAEGYRNQPTTAARSAVAMVRISAAGQGEGVELGGAVVSEWVFD
jgi:hypothetical protein